MTEFSLLVPLCLITNHATKTWRWKYRWMRYYVDVSGQCHDPASLPVEKFPRVPIVKEPAWALEQFSTLWRRVKSLAFADNRTPISRLFSLYPNAIPSEISSSLCWLIPTDLCVDLHWMDAKTCETCRITNNTSEDTTHASSHWRRALCWPLGTYREFHVALGVRWDCSA